MNCHEQVIKNEALAAQLRAIRQQLMAGEPSPLQQNAAREVLNAVGLMMEDNRQRQGGVEFASEELAKRSYIKYAEAVGFKDPQGNTLPEWEKVPFEVQVLWRRMADIDDIIIRMKGNKA